MARTKPASRVFEPVPKFKIGPTVLRGDNLYCRQCGVCFGDGLHLEKSECIKCGAPWPESSR